VRPYLSKKGKWGVLAGNPTWAFMCVLNMPDDWKAKTGDYDVRRGLRALEDAGLVRIELGPRGGMATARVEWLPRAFLAPQRLAPADDAALGELA
jgi:hypothetical protein